MTFLFTQEDLIRYMYKETSPAKTRAIEKALETDFELNQRLNELTSLKETLNTQPLQSPRRKTIDNILEYARKSAEITVDE